MKKLLFSSFLVSVFIVSCCLLFSTGCGNSGSATTTTTTTTSTTSVSTTSTTSESTTSTTSESTTTTATSTSTTTVTIAGATFSLTGTLANGVLASGISASGVRSQAVAYTSMQDYTIVAVSETGKVYFPDAKTDSSGNFSFSNLPAGQSFNLDVFNSSNQLICPIAMGASTEGVKMAINPPATTAEAGYSLGTIAYDSSKATAAPTMEPTNIVSHKPEDVALVKSGETLVPKGAGNLGKGDDAHFTGTYDINKVDGDRDGLPNVFDADNNSDGFLDEFDGLVTREIVVVSTAESKINGVSIFTNLKVPFMHSNTYWSSWNIYYFLNIMIDPKPGYTISSAYLAEGPAWKDTPNIHTAMSPMESDYDTHVGERWSAQSPDYKLWITQSTPNMAGVYLDNFLSSTEVSAGDMLKFVVNFSDGTSEEVCKMVNYSYRTIPRLTQYSFNRGSTWTNAPAPVAGSITTAPTSEISLRWSRPLDESGSDIIGARYTWEINTTNEPEMIAAGADTGTTSSLEVTYDVGSYVTSGTNFGINICIRNMVNDNASQNLQFDKGW